MEWIRYEILHNNNLGISQIAKDKWNRTYILPVNNFDDPHVLNLVNYDANNNGILEQNEKIIYADVGLPQEQWTYSILKYDDFAFKFGASAAQNRTKQALLDSKDLEHRYSGFNYDGIGSTFGFRDPLTEKRTINLIDQCGAAGYYQQELDRLAGTVYALDKLKGLNAFKDRNVEIYAPADDKFEFWVSDY